MGKRVFSTEFAPDEEIEGVKSCLERAGIAHYEIKNSRLWLGGGSICVSDPKDYERARSVIDEFEAAWRERARQESTERRIDWKPVIGLALVLALFVFVTIKSLGG